MLTYSATVKLVELSHWRRYALLTLNANIKILTVEDCQELLYRRENTVSVSHHFDVDAATGSRENPYETKPNTTPQQPDRLCEHTEKVASGLAFNGYPKLLLFLIPLRQLPFLLATNFDKNTLAEILSRT